MPSRAIGTRLRPRVKLLAALVFDIRSKEVCCKPVTACGWRLSWSISDGRVLWSARFDEPYSDLFVLQDKVTMQVAGVLAIRVTEIEQRRALAKPGANLASYDFLLRARPALQRPTRAELVQARSLLHRAIEIDPNNAAAYAALAETYFTATSMGWTESPSEAVDRAEAMANKALALDEFRCAGTHYSRSHPHLLSALRAGPSRD